MPVSILPLEADAIESVVEMMARLYAHGSDPFDAQRARRATAALLAEPGYGGVWTIRVDSAQAGYLVLVLGYSLEFGGRFGLLDELYIEEPWRGKGLGGQAVDFAANRCRERGWRALRLEVGQENQPALALYSRRGFQMHDRFLMTKWV